ncbi:MAG: hypothetical protein U1E65_29660 [Myxococcota bacterium]
MAKLDYTPPTELHAIAIHAHKLIQEGGGRLSKDAVQAILGALQALYDDIYQLADAAHSLGAVMLYCEQNKKPAAEQLQEIIRFTRPRFQAFNEEVKADQVNEARTAEKNLMALEGKKEVLRAQKLGEKAPKGSVPLASIAPRAVGIRSAGVPKR